MENEDLLRLPVIDSLKGLAGPDRPVHRAAGDPKLPLDLVDQLKGVPRLTVHLIDKCKNRNMAAGTDLEKLSRLGLHTLGTVDDHDRRVCRHERSIGVLGEILMAGRVQDINAEPAVIELEDRGSDRDTSLLLDLHPVRNRMSRRRLALYGTCEIDRTAVEQEFFCQCCLARVGVRDDRERPAPSYFVHEMLPQTVDQSYQNIVSNFCIFFISLAASAFCVRDQSFLKPFPSRRYSVRTISAGNSVRSAAKYRPSI